MARIVNRYADPPPELRIPRDDIVHEMREADGSFSYADGPFGSYQRTLTDEPDGAVTEVVEYELAVPYFGFVFAPLVRHTLRQPAGDKAPWWAPPERLDARAATALGVLAAVGLIVGYLNTLLTQTIAFAADEFGSTDRAQGVSLAIVRCGVLLALVIGESRIAADDGGSSSGSRWRARSSPRPGRCRRRCRGSRHRKQSRARSPWRSESSSPSSRWRRCPRARVHTR